MSKRHQKKPDTKSEFALWVKENAHLVDASGLPSLYLSTEDHWNYFLDHGNLYRFDDDPSEFDVDELTPLQKAALMRLFLACPGCIDTQTGRELVRDLVEAVEKAYPKQRF